MGIIQKVGPVLESSFREQSEQPPLDAAHACCREHTRSDYENLRDRSEKVSSQIRAQSRFLDSDCLINQNDKKIISSQADIRHARFVSASL
jgi:hypothetical protein